MEVRSTGSIAATAAVTHQKTSLPAPIVVPAQDPPIGRPVRPGPTDNLSEGNTPLSALVVRAGSGISFAAENRDLVELSHLAVAARYPTEPDDVIPDVAKRAVATGLRIQREVQRALEAEGFR